MTEQNHAYEQARSQVDGINEMVAALECDYDRLEELRDDLETLEDAVNDATDDQDKADAAASLGAWEAENDEEFALLKAAAGDCTDQDDAQQRIQEDPLSVEIRSGWYSPGETPEPYEFTILLCTGGPAVRIVGELDQYNQPSRAWIEYQDWGTPWTEYHGGNVDGEKLLAYCRQFYFGE